MAQPHLAHRSRPRKANSLAAYWKGSFRYLLAEVEKILGDKRLVLVRVYLAAGAHFTVVEGVVQDMEHNAGNERLAAVAEQSFPRHLEAEFLDGIRACGIQREQVLHEVRLFGVGYDVPVPLIPDVLVPERGFADPYAVPAELLELALHVVGKLEDIAACEHDGHVPAEQVGAVGILVYDQILAVEVDFQLSGLPQVVEQDGFPEAALETVNRVHHEGDALFGSLNFSYDLLELLPVASRGRFLYLMRLPDREPFVFDIVGDAHDLRLIRVLLLVRHPRQ